MRLAGNENESEIGNGATRWCDRRGATCGSWGRGPLVGSPLVGSLFVGSLFVGSWVCGFAVRGSWVCCSWAREFVGSPFMGSLFVGLCDSLFVGSTISLVVRRSRGSQE